MLYKIFKDVKNTFETTILTIKGGVALYKQTSPPAWVVNSGQGLLFYNQLGSMVALKNNYSENGLTSL